MTSRNIKAAVARSSFGTRKAVAAQRSVSAEVAARVIARSSTYRKATAVPKPQRKS